MKKVSLALAVSAVISSSAFAHHPGVWIDSAGNVVKDGQSDCLRSISNSGNAGNCAGGQTTPAPVVVAPAADLEAKLQAQKDALAAKLAAEKKAAAAKLASEKQKAMAVVQDLTLKSDASFKTGGATLSAAGKAELDGVYKKMALLGGAIKGVTLVGHADSRGNDAFNQRLSEKRAKAVKDYLVSKGYSANKLKTKGMGETKPIATNKTAAGRAANRRVEFIVEK